MPDGAVRLGIMVEHDAPAEVVGRLAVLAERAGLHALLLAPLVRRWTGPPPLPSVFERLAAAAARTGTLTLGAYLAQVPASADVPAAMAGRFEVTVPEAALPVGWVFGLPVIVALDAVRPGPLPAGVSGALVPVAALSSTPSGSTERHDRLAVEIGASVGRTASEAAARVERDGRLRGRRDPRASGLFGTLEECQARVAQLARLGVNEVRCWLPDLPDIADVIAQLSAVAVAANAPPAAAAALKHAGRPPAPPEGWGGRPRREPGGRDE